MAKPVKRPDTVEVREIYPEVWVAIDKQGFLKIATDGEIDVARTEKFEKKRIKKSKP